MNPLSTRSAKLGRPWSSARAERCAPPPPPERLAPAPPRAARPARRGAAAGRGAATAVAGAAACWPASSAPAGPARAAGAPEELLPREASPRRRLAAGPARREGAAGRKAGPAASGLPRACRRRETRDGVAADAKAGQAGRRVGSRAAKVRARGPAQPAPLTLPQRRGADQSTVHARRPGGPAPSTHRARRRRAGRAGAARQSSPRPPAAGRHQAAGHRPRRDSPRRCHRRRRLQQFQGCGAQCERCCAGACELASWRLSCACLFCHSPGLRTLPQPRAGSAQKPASDIWGS